MSFEALARVIEPRLRQIALKYARRHPFLDAEDLLAEMKAYLWQGAGEGAFEGKTESFIVQACYFFLRNYLRKMRDAAEPLSLDEPVRSRAADEGEDIRLEELIPGEDGDAGREIEGNDLYEQIMNNGFSPREKTIIRLLCAGYTVREAGEKLHISHAMVIKHKKHIIRRLETEYAGYLS